MKNIKRALSFITAIIMCISIVSVSAYAETSVVLKSTVWTMSSHGATSSNITSDFEWKNLSIKATETKYVSFDSSYMKTQGAANVITFKAAGPCTITVTAKSNSTTLDRYAVVSDRNGVQIGTDITAPMSGDGTGKVEYTGYGEEISITPKGGGISIKSIAVEYKNTNNLKGDINGDGKIDSADAAMLLRYIMGADDINDDAALSAANGNNDGIINVLDANWILNNVYEPTSETTTVEAIDTSDGVEVRSYSELTAVLANAGAKTYIMNDIEMGDQVKLSMGGQSIIGVPDENGALPILNFANMTGKNDVINGKSSDGDAGVRILSANNVVKNLVIEKAHDNGILMKEVGTTGNLVENCILRYNNDSGMQITKGACGNVVKGVYSYRNCDVFTLGGNADGFAIKLSAGPELTTDSSVMDANKNTFTECYAWENSDDGWDSFDYPLNQQDASFQSAGGRWTYRNDYTNCITWNNGTPANSFGYNDYINGLSLDENLPFIMRFKALSDEATYNNFVSQYNAGTLCSRSASASTYYSNLDSIFGAIPTVNGSLKASQISNSTNWQGNPNGFKLGSAYTQSNSERYMKNCIAFDHLASGFDKNNSGAKIYAENCIAFGNKINYNLNGYTAYSWKNVFGWAGTSGNSKPNAASGVTVAINDGSSKEETVRAAAERITGYAAGNKMVYSNVFESVF